MTTDAVFTRPVRAEKISRQIALRTRGHSHGRVTRLVSPGDIGERIKPFVFLDYFDADPATGPKFGFHPHSGIATLTLILAGQAFYKETTGREGVIETGGVEWMRASSGVWHTGGMFGKERIKGFQLWVAMPPELELAEPQSQYLGASDFDFAGPARVIAGEYGGVKSIVESPRGITYLDVRLKARERWTFHPAKGHDVAWIASHQGMVTTPEQVSMGEVAVFEEGDQAIEIEALSDVGFILGSAVKHPYDLVTGHYSVHTNADSLRIGESNIADIGRRLHNQGVLARKTLRIREIGPSSRLTMEETMFGSGGVQLLQRMAGARECRGRSDRRLPLRSEHFPVEARGREILTQHGVMIAVATDPAMSEEIARRLNKSDWSDQEDQWAL